MKVIHNLVKLKVKPIFEPMKHGSLFSGIGGFDLAAEWMGWNNVFHCEWNEFGKQILKYYWPQAISYHDITKTDFTIHKGEIDILTGGFPCQPYSLAGKRKGKEDERHLWPEMLRAIREIQPTYVVAENVSGLINWNGGMVFNEVQTEMEAEGYEVWAFVLPACAVNAPHRRDRVWFVGHRISDLESVCEHGTFENSDSNGRNDKQRENKSGFREQRNISTGDNERIRADNEEIGVASDTDSNQRPERRVYQVEYQEAERHAGPRNARSHQCTSWHNFPTQSPICRRNDGIPRELDGITFPKWRNESIKAYGNAIVPQVALEIFKAIEKIHETS